MTAVLLIDHRGVASSLHVVRPTQRVERACVVHACLFASLVHGRDHNVRADDWVKIGTESVVISHPFTDKVRGSRQWEGARAYSTCDFAVYRTHSSFKCGEGDDNVDEAANDGLRRQSLQTGHRG